MDDYGKAFGELFKAAAALFWVMLFFAIVGAIAVLAGVGWLIWWLAHHAKIA